MNISEILTGIKSWVVGKLNLKQDALAWDDTPTEGSDNPVTSDGIHAAIVTALSHNAVNDTTLPIASADTLNKIYYIGPDANDNFEMYVTSFDGTNYSWVDLGTTALNLTTKQDTLTFDNTPTINSTNPVTSGGVYTELAATADQINQLDQALINYARVEGTRLIFEVSSGDETDGYIYDGLVMRLDGIRQGNTEGSWKDLVGGVVFGNTGCIFNTDNVQFPSDSWGYLTGSMQGVPSATGTIEIAFEADNLSGANRFLFYPSTAGCLCVAYANSLNTFIWGITDTYARTMYTPSKLSGKTVVSFNGLAGGVQDKSALVANGVNSFGNPTDTTYIGRRDGSTASQKFVGKIYAIRIYNRQLTMDEILHNQQIDNERFNLGL